MQQDRLDSKQQLCLSYLINNFKQVMMSLDTDQMKNTSIVYDNFLSLQTILKENQSNIAFSKPIIDELTQFIEKYEFHLILKQQDKVLNEIKEFQMPQLELTKLNKKQIQLIQNLNKEHDKAKNIPKKNFQQLLDQLSSNQHPQKVQSVQNEDANNENIIYKQGHFQQDKFQQNQQINNFLKPKDAENNFPIFKRQNDKQNNQSNNNNQSNQFNNNNQNNQFNNDNQNNQFNNNKQNNQFNNNNQKNNFQNNNNNKRNQQKDNFHERMQNRDKNISEGFITANDQIKIQNPYLYKQQQNNQEDYQEGKKSGLKKKFIPPFKQSKALIESGLANNLSKQNKEQSDNKYKDLDNALVEQIEQNILSSTLDIEWDDISGLEEAKQSIYEAIVWPMLRPDIFTGLRAPPKGLLLFGPPGTGKTLIGKAIASQSKAVFFSLSASNLTSKWIGEGEKLVRTLFKLAEYKAPSVIFIDEVDSLLCARSDTENEASRKIKTEFLVQLEGVSQNASKRVLFIGATNRPQELDDAVRRRFTKRLYIPLANETGRSQLLTRLASQKANDICLSSSEITHLASLTEMYSGADLKTLATEAAMMPLRKAMKDLSVQVNQIPATTCDDFLQALKMVKPSVDQSQLASFHSFNQQFGTFS